MGSAWSREREYLRCVRGCRPYVRVDEAEAAAKTYRWEVRLPGRTKWLVVSRRVSAVETDAALRAHPNDPDFRVVLETGPST